MQESKSRSKYGVGTIFETNRNGKAMVIEYKNCREVLVQFLDTGYETWTKTGKIHSGIIRDKTLPTVFGVGYTEEGKYSIIENGGIKPGGYKAWYNMLRRCYDEGSRHTYPTYQGCSVNPAWHHYQDFAEFYYENPWRQEGWHLEKDILVKGNKEYGPEACVFAPAAINCLYNKMESQRGDCPLGVFYSVRKEKYIAHYRKEGQTAYIGLFLDPTEAFYAVKEKKEALVKSIADEWRDRIDPRLYEALYQYTVEITD